MKGATTQRVLFPNVDRRGIALETPIVEFYYKMMIWTILFINDEHVKFLKIASDQEIAFLERGDLVGSMSLLSDWFRQIGLKLIDFKLEILTKMAHYSSR